MLSVYSRYIKKISSKIFLLNPLPFIINIINFVIVVTVDSRLAGVWRKARFFIPVTFFTFVKIHPVVDRITPTFTSRVIILNCIWQKQLRWTSLHLSNVLFTILLSSFLSPLVFSCGLAQKYFLKRLIYFWYGGRCSWLQLSVGMYWGRSKTLCYQLNMAHSRTAIM